MLEYIVLGMIQCQNQGGLDITGYEIKKYIDHGVAFFYKASYGSLYPILKRLVSKGWIVGYEKMEGGRQKKYYRITKGGSEKFFEWLTEPVLPEEGDSSQLIKVYFFDLLPKEKLDEKLQEYQEKHEQYLKKLKELAKEFETFENRERFYFKISTIYYGISVVEARIHWCQMVQRRQEFKIWPSLKEEKR